MAEGLHPGSRLIVFTVVEYKKNALVLFSEQFSGLMVWTGGPLAHKIYRVKCFD